MNEIKYDVNTMELRAFIMGFYCGVSINKYSMICGAQTQTVNKTSVGSQAVKAIIISW